MRGAICVSRLDNAHVHPVRQPGRCELLADKLGRQHGNLITIQQTKPGRIGRALRKREVDDAVSITIKACKAYPCIGAVSVVAVRRRQALLLHPFGPAPAVQLHVYVKCTRMRTSSLEVTVTYDSLCRK